MKSESHYRINKEGHIVKHIKIEESLPRKKFLRNEGNNDLSVINFGYYLVSPLVIGVFLGLLIGDKFHMKEKGAFIGIIFGLVGTIYNLIHIVKSNARD